MWLWFSLTACSASETKLAPTVGTRTALQYCRTLACSNASVWLFIGLLPPFRPAAGHTRPSPASGVQTAPALPPRSEHIGGVVRDRACEKCARRRLRR